MDLLDAVDLQLRNIVCTGSNPAPAPTTSASSPSPPPAGNANPACHGSTDGYVCSNGAPGFATPCDSAKEDVFCADLTQVCKRASAADATATVDSDGALECE